MLQWIPEPSKTSSADTTELIQHWKEIVKSGVYCMTRGKWKKYYEPKFLRNERRVIEEKLQQIIRGRDQRDLRRRNGPQHSGGFQPQTRQSEQWTVDPFWEIDRPTPAQQQDMPGPSSTPTSPNTPQCLWKKAKSTLRPVQ